MVKNRFRYCIVLTILCSFIVPLQATLSYIVRAHKDPRVLAFLDMIAFAEVTDSPHGYNMQYPGVVFNGYKDHPRTVMSGMVEGTEIRSTAAGRYQILAKTWDKIAKIIQAPDFSPLYQDYAAIQLIYERGALKDIVKGDIKQAILKVNKIWAPLAGAPFGQPTKSLQILLSVYAAKLKARKQIM